MLGALLTMFLMIFGLIGGMVAGAIIQTQRLKGIRWALVALASTYVAGSASSAGIRIALFIICAVAILSCYIDSVVRAREEARSQTIKRVW